MGKPVSYKRAWTRPCKGRLKPCPWPWTIPLLPSCVSHHSPPKISPLPPFSLTFLALLPQMPPPYSSACVWASPLVHLTHGSLIMFLNILYISSDWKPSFVPYCCITKSTFLSLEFTVLQRMTLWSSFCTWHSLPSCTLFFWLQAIPLLMVFLVFFLYTLVYSFGF